MLKGLAEGGGLYLPEEIPSVEGEWVCSDFLLTSLGEGVYVVG